MQPMHLVPAQPRPKVVDGNSLYDGAPYDLNPVPLPDGHPQNPDPQDLNAYPISASAWQFAADGPSRWDFGDGSAVSPDEVESTGHTFDQPGVYTVTATGTDGRVGTLQVNVTAGQGTDPPTISAVAPTEVSKAVGPTVVTLTGTGFAADDVVELGFQTATTTYTEVTPTNVTPTQITFTFDPAGHVDFTLVLVWVRQSSGKATHQVSFTVVA